VASGQVDLGAAEEEWSDKGRVIIIDFPYPDGTDGTLAQDLLATASWKSPRYMGPRTTKFLTRWPTPARTTMS